MQDDVPVGLGGLRLKSTAELHGHVAIDCPRARSPKVVARAPARPGPGGPLPGRHSDGPVTTNSDVGPFTQAALALMRLVTGTARASVWQCLHIYSAI